MSGEIDGAALDGQTQHGDEHRRNFLRGVRHVAWTNGRIAPGNGREPVMDGQEKSGRSVAPRKPSNKPAATGSGRDEPQAGTKTETPNTVRGEPAVAGRDEVEGAEGEGRDLAKESADQQDALRAQSRAGAPSGLDRVRAAARRDKDAKFTALFHHITLDALNRAFLSLKRRAADAVDAVTWEHYAQDVEAKLAALHEKLNKGEYRAKPWRRVLIPKADGRPRPLGIASLEDEIVQRAVVELLNAIYETDFVDFSYGFRPGRGQQDALDALAAGITWEKVNWVLDADIRGFFDSIDHGWLVRFVEHRIADRRILRLIQKWLSAGVLEEGRRTEAEEGAPQGATISPLLANVYLHYVLDLWVQQWRRRHAKGDVVIVRYADAFVLGFQHRKDAERFRWELAKRLRRFALELHPEKTRLIEFGRYAVRDRKARGLRKPETFTFLGVVHICSEVRERFVLVTRQAHGTTRRQGHGTRVRRERPIGERLNRSVAANPYLRRSLSGVDGSLLGGALGERTGLLDRGPETRPVGLRPR